MLKLKGFFFNLTYFLKRCCICTAEILLGNMNKYNDHFYCMWHVLYGYYFELYIFFSGRQRLHLFIYSFPTPFPFILFLCLLLFLVKENKMHFKYVLIFLFFSFFLVLELKLQAALTQPEGSSPP